MKQYLNLMDHVMTHGTYKEPAREGMNGSMSYFGYQMRFNLLQNFPLVTTKKMFWKGIVAELLWFLKGDTNIKFLVDNGVNIWNDDAYNYYRNLCEKHSIAPFSKNDFITVIRNNDDLEHGNIPGYNFGDCGYQYGKVWRNWSQPEADEFGSPTGANVRIDQIVRVLIGLRDNPQSRRHVVTAVDPIHDKDLALYWCHSMFQFNVRPTHFLTRKTYYLSRFENSELELMDLDIIDEQFLDKEGVPKYYLDCQMYQRSADLFLGVPFNIASYSLLTLIFSELCGFFPGEFIHTIGDAHVYDNHYEAVKEQLSRTPYPEPEVKINIPDLKAAFSRGEDVSQIINSLDFHNFELLNYKCHPSIKADLNTGTGK